jgi:hypothetical protein
MDLKSESSLNFAAIKIYLNLQFFSSSMGRLLR